MEDKLGRMNELMKRLDGKSFSKEPIKTSPTIRDLLSITRKLNEEEDNDEDYINTSTEADFEYEKSKATKFLSGMALRFTDKNGKPYFKKTNKRIVWGGVVNGIIRFLFIVEENKSKSNIVLDYTDDFSPDNPENDEIIKSLESYYDSFYERWIDKINAN